MAKAITWHPEAKEDFREIVAYLMEAWSPEVAEKFTEQVDKTQELIRLQPGIGVRVGRLRSVRKVSIPPHHAMYYTFLNEAIWILNLLDQRQNPERI